MYMTGYQCLCCAKQLPVDFSDFVCPACGSNLEITYDYYAIRKELDHGFPAHPDTIFRFLPLLPIRDAASGPSLRIGNTPLYHAPRLGELAGLKHLYIKDDGLNPSASFKDRASAVAIARAVETGAPLAAGASTGNAGSSMACLSASIGRPCVIFVPEKAPEAKITQLLIFGARVVPVKGTYDDAFDLCMKICAQHGWFNRNTGFNPFTREGKKTCSFEIFEQCQRKMPDWIAVSTGDGNIISGIWKGLRDLKSIGFIEKTPRLLCCQSEKSAAVSHTVASLKKHEKPDWRQVTVEAVEATTVADSISVDIPRDGLAAVRAVVESHGAAITVPDQEILNGIGEMARFSGVFAEPAAATTWACIKKAVNEGIVNRDEKIVCISTGNGLKDVAAARRAVQSPCSIEPTVDAAEKALADLITA